MKQNFGRKNCIKNVCCFSENFLGDGDYSGKKTLFWHSVFIFPKGFPLWYLPNLQVSYGVLGAFFKMGPEVKKSRGSPERYRMTISLLECFLV
jgi:hypothetical protein